MTAARFTIFESPDPLAKRWHLDDNGQPVKTVAAQMTRGTYRTETVSDVHDLARVLEDLTTCQAFCASTPTEGGAP